MEQCYAEFLCTTRRIGLLGFVVRRHTQIQGISGAKCILEIWKEYLDPEMDNETWNRYIRPRIIADASTSELQQILEK